MTTIMTLEEEVQECAQTILYRLSSPDHPGVVRYIEYGPGTLERSKPQIAKKFGFGEECTDELVCRALELLEKGNGVLVTRERVRDRTEGSRGKVYSSETKVTVELS